MALCVALCVVLAVGDSLGVSDDDAVSLGVALCEPDTDGVPVLDGGWLGERLAPWLAERVPLELVVSAWDAVVVPLRVSVWLGLRVDDCVRDVVTLRDCEGLSVGVGERVPLRV